MSYLGASKPVTQDVFLAKKTDSISQASLRLPQMGEWWCPPDIDDVDESFTEEVILDMEQRLSDWHKTWAEQIQSGRSL